MQDQRRLRLHDVLADILKLRATFPEVFDTFSVDTAMSKINNGLDKQLILRHNDLSLLYVGNFNMTSKTEPLEFPFSGNWYNYNDSTEVVNYSAGNTYNKALAPGEYAIYTDRPVAGGHVVTDIDKLMDNIDIKAYPNPTSDKLIIEISESAFAPKKWALYDNIGRKVKEQEINGNGNTYQLSLEGVPEGLYLLRLMNSTWHKEIIVRKEL